MQSGYRNQPGIREGQKGPRYEPGLSKSGNPLQDVRNINRMPQEDSYEMQPGRFMPEINNISTEMTSGNRAIIRPGHGSQVGNQNFDVRQKTFGQLDENLHTQWVDTNTDFPSRK